MKIARLSLEQGPRFAVIEEPAQRYHVIAGDPLYSGIEQTGQVFNSDEARLVAPMLPRSKVVGSTTSFVQNMATPSAAKLYLKPNTSVVGVDVPVVVPQWASRVTSAPNLAVVISRPCRDVPPERVADVIFGYTMANAICAPDFAQDSPAQAFAFDTSCPLGLVIDTAFEAGEYEVFSEINDAVLRGTIDVDADKVAEYVAKVSQVFSLLPGDVILLGDALEPVEIATGDDVVVSIGDMGDLRNPVVAS
ncbi:2-keto-4-pentenoate hydratase/2-oxohepta-3-ene-1,7-dioic acid hydratase in catechol pathway [Arcanobacterium pluranimalium]|uniref:fumarylacetoacetate hydrolase family protein n=1 Tax=Arcanobacterium pluranimalium TaxID=108028 RepID=UPI00195678D2|nr:fumarylacetoacetate hydrolase family protein [Arcanobacterium pluranimalium]MBM7825202.1 2-keto-4-pentenoate hydratase/2-oxohepta-3-ene-1,7-dioic acid hydratase in catechol pathway [Arcanobacterium pluranimalium]